MLLYETNHVRIKRRKRMTGKKLIALCAALVLVIGTVGATIAWLTAQTNPIVNTFDPSHVSCKVDENFNSESGLKEHVKIQNTSDIPAYIRVRLVSYHKEGDTIVGGAGELPQDEDLNLTGWVRIGAYYYCKVPVAANDFTPELIESYQLKEGQVLEVLAEAIQSEPSDAVTEAWGVSVDAEGNIQNKEA